MFENFGRALPMPWRPGLGGSFPVSAGRQFAARLDEIRFDLAADLQLGALSLVIIMLSGLFVGMVLGLQGFQLLQRFGSEEALGTAATIGLVKELGPVVTALLFAGRAGTALASELGLMRATDQISAMEMMAVDPIQRVVVPRFLGGVIAMPLLAAIFSVIGIYGAQLVGVQIMGVDAGSFWSQMRAAVSLSDITEGIVKSLVFGVACSLIAVYQGYYATPTAEGVGTRHNAHRRHFRRGDFVPRLLDYRSVFVGVLLCASHAR